jgi:membrane protein implicated in regulation of membrane protease activity
MGRNRDIALILLVVVLGMFVPFFGSIVYVYGLNVSRLVVGFVVFVVLFGVELGVVYAYFKISGKRSAAEVERLRPKT